MHTSEENGVANAVVFL